MPDSAHKTSLSATLRKWQRRLLKNMSNTGRAIDLTYPTNAWISGLAVLAGALGLGLALSRGTDLLAALWFGVLAGLVTIFTWALGRELDPDREWAAFVGVLPAVLVFYSTGALYAWTLVAVLLLARIVNRTAEPPALIMDSVLALALTAAALYLETSWVFGLVAGLAFALDASLLNPLRRQWPFAGAALLLSGAAFLAQENSAPHLPDGGYLVGGLVIAAGFAAHLLMTRQVYASTDRGAGYPLDTTRVRWGMGLAWLGALLLAIWGGNAAMQATAPLWAALGGVAAYRGGQVWIKR